MTAVWPPIEHDKLVAAEEESLARELKWLLDSLRATFTSVKSGLEECAGLLSSDKGASTLVLSSLRSESIKGLVTRVGTRIIKADVNLKFASIPPPKNQNAHRLQASSAPQAPDIALSEITDARNMINAALDVVDVSLWTGDSGNAGFIAGQLRLLYDHVYEARQHLKGSQVLDQRSWWEHPLDNRSFDPPCPDNISFHLSVADAAVVLHVRTLEPADAPPAYESVTGLSLRERVAFALGAPRVAPHEELGERFSYKGREVRVREMHRVESQDPNLLSAMAKLNALEHSVATSRTALATVMQTDL